MISFPQSPEPWRHVLWLFLFENTKVTPLGPAAGAGLGVVTGVGAANSLGVEAGAAAQYA